MTLGGSDRDTSSTCVRLYRSIRLQTPYGLVRTVLVDAAADLSHAVAEAGLGDHGQGGERRLGGKRGERCFGGVGLNARDVHRVPRTGKRLESGCRRRERVRIEE